MKKIAALKSNFLLLIDRPSDVFFILFSYLITAFFYFPKLLFINSNSLSSQFINRQINEIFFYRDALIYPDKMHEAKSTFRIAVPLIGKLLHLTATGLIYFQFVIYFLFLFVLYQVLKNTVQSKTETRLLLLAFCFTYVGKSFFNVTPFFDCYAFLFVLLTFYFKNPLLLFACSIVCFYTDERADLAVLFSVLWHSREQLSQTVNGIKKFIPTINSISIIAGLIFALVLRLFLTQQYQVQVTWSMIGVDAFLNNKNFIPLGLLMAFEGFWWLVLLSLFTEKKMVAGLNFILTCLVLLGAFMVYDLTRSVAYAFPAIFIAIFCVKNELSEISFQSLAILVLASCILIPTYSIINPTVSFLAPFYTTVFDFIK